MRGLDSVLPLGVLEPLDRYDEDAEAVDVSEFNKHDDRG